MSNWAGPKIKVAKTPMPGMKFWIEWEYCFAHIFQMKKNPERVIHSALQKYTVLEHIWKWSSNKNLFEGGFVDNSIGSFTQLILQEGF